MNIFNVLQSVLKQNLVSFYMQTLKLQLKNRTLAIKEKTKRKRKKTFMNQ